MYMKVILGYIICRVSSIRTQAGINVKIEYTYARNIAILKIDIGYWISYEEYTAPFTIHVFCDSIHQFNIH